MAELTLPDEVHLHGCPADPTRIERDDLRRADGSEVIRLRCLSCGAQSLFQKEKTDADNR